VTFLFAVYHVPGNFDLCGIVSTTRSMPDYLQPFSYIDNLCCSYVAFFVVLLFMCHDASVILYGCSLFLYTTTVSI